MTRVAAFLRAFRWIYLVPVLLVVALGAWAFASPVGSSPDDDFHLSSIWCANPANTNACMPGEAANERYVPALIKSPHICYAAKPAVSASCQARTVDFSSEPTELTTRGSFSNNYPPIYYFTMSLFIGPDIVVSVMVMRFVNIVLFVGLTSALFALLPLRFRVPLGWAWLISIVPLGAFLIASNNPSSWALIGVATAAAGLLGFFNTVGRKRVALGVLFAVGAVMAAGARADSAIYTVIAIGGVLLLEFTRSRSFLLRAILPVALALFAFLLYVTSGQANVAASGLGSTTALPTGRSMVMLVAFNLLHVPDLFAGVFGSWGLGWLDVSLPPLVTFCAGVTFVGLTFTGLFSARWRKVVVVTGVALLLVALPTYVLIRGGNIVGEVLQPRYLLPLILLFALFALVQPAGTIVRLGTAQVVFVFAALSVANAIAMHVNIQRYVSGADQGGIMLDDPNGWWWTGFPISPMVTWFIGSIAFTAAAGLATRELSRLNARSPEADLVRP